MADSSAEKDQEPTAKRLREAREKGQIPRSRELSNLAGVAALVLCLKIMGPVMVDTAQKFLRQSLSLERGNVVTIQQATERLSDAMWSGFLWVLPLLVVGFLAAFLAPIVFGGWNVSSKALQPDLERLNALAGLKRVFSMNALVELAKGLAKFFLLGGIAIVVLWDARYLVLGLGGSDLGSAVELGLELCITTLASLCLGLAVIAGIDVPFQHYSHRKKLKMTLQEVKDESKESEGRPEVKQHIRQMQMTMARRRMSQKIPEASVVINNPEHFSVALRYDPDSPGAPVVVAKGADHLAEVIRELAAEHKVPQLRVPALARALYRHVDIDEEIPQGLFLAVAQVLSYIFALKNTPQQAGDQPQPEIPGEYQWNPDGGKSASTS